MCCCVNNTRQLLKLEDTEFVDRSKYYRTRRCSTTTTTSDTTQCCYVLHTTEQQQQKHGHEQRSLQQQQQQPLSPACSSTRTSFNSKYRRKYLYLLILVLFHVCSSSLARVTAYNCTAAGGCQNNGSCKEGQCICADGWQGPECQFCGGKVRYVW